MLKEFFLNCYFPPFKLSISLGLRSYRLLVRNLTRILHGKWTRKSDITLPFPEMLLKEPSDKITKMTSFERAYEMKES